MNNGLFRKEPGQSIPIIVLVIVVLIGMVALAVDVGNTYSQQRDLVRAAQAAAVTGMDQVIMGRPDSAVKNAITDSLKANGIYTDTYRWEAWYKDVSGETVFTCKVGECGDDLLASTKNKNIAYIDLKVDGSSETFFARLFGQDELPVVTNAASGLCAPTSGVFPIAISPNSVGWVNDPLPASQGGVGTQAGFLVPRDTTERPYYQIFSTGDQDSANYYRKRMRRIYLDAGLTDPGRFTMLRWHGSQGSAEDVRAMMSVGGNLDNGFREEFFDEGWPFAAPACEADGRCRPEGYPLRPGQLTPGNNGDWVSGLDMSLMATISPQDNPLAGIREQLEYHRTQRTEMILPMVNQFGAVPVDDNGTVVNRYAYQIDSLGKFLLVGYSGNPGPSATGGALPDENRPYLDLVYLGGADPVPCKVEQIQTPEKYGLLGRIEVRPILKEERTSEVPNQFMIVMDESGSMTLNFNGQGSKNGKVLQCDPTGDPALDQNITEYCWGGKEQPYMKENERRIYIMKNAIIEEFVDKMKPTDVIGFVKYSGNTSKPEGYKHDGSDPNWQAGQQQFWFYGNNPRDKANLKRYIMYGNKPDSDPYISEGHTPSASALRSAAEVLEDADGKYKTPRHVPNNPDMVYNQVVVFFTDGVANKFLDPIVVGNKWYYNVHTKEYDGEDFANEFCPEGVWNYNNNVTCNIGTIGPSINPKYTREFDLPITAMINQSQRRLQGELGAQVFTVAIGPIPEQGLIDTASSPNFFARITKPEEVRPLLQHIKRVVTNSCVETGLSADVSDQGWISTIPRQNWPLNSLWADSSGAPLTQPPAVMLNQVPPVIGFVTIKPQFGDGATLGENYRIPIEIESTRFDREVMSFHLPAENGLPPGEYKMSAFVYYKDKNGETRPYSTFWDPSTAQEATEVTFNISPNETNKTVVLGTRFLKIDRQYQNVCEPGPTEPGLPTGGTEIVGVTDPGTNPGTTDECVWTGVEGAATVNISAGTNRYGLTFQGATNNGDGTSTWTYNVTRDPSAKDLSHWTLSLPECVSVVSYSPTQGAETGKDPTTNLTGIKWNNYANGGTFTVTISDGGCAKAVEPGPTSAAMKTGGNKADQAGTGIVTGPVLSSGCAVQNPTAPEAAPEAPEAAPEAPEAAPEPEAEAPNACVWTSANAAATVNISAGTNRYGLTFQGATNNGDRTSTWTYNVTRDPSAKDLSHWTLSLPECVSVVSYSPTQGAETGKDPTTNLTGIKWNNYANGGTFTVTINDSGCANGVNPGPTSAAMKTGGNKADQAGTGIVTGPVECTP